MELIRIFEYIFIHKNTFFLVLNVKNKIRITRREFLNSLLAILSVPAILWWLHVGRRNEKIRAHQDKIFIGEELPAGISFIGPAIIINNGSVPKAFEAKCTHLGCRISETKGEELLCQCHGSRFDENGRAVKGPAKKALHKMEIVRDKDGYYLIYS